MNSGLKIAGLVVGGLLLVGGGAAAGTMVARAQAPAAITAFGGPTGPGMMTAPGTGWMAAYRSQMVASLAGSLGMTADQLNQELQSDKTLAQIAQEKNLSADQLQQAILKAQTDVIAQAVKDGKLTQAQADQMLALMKQHPGIGFGFGFGSGMGPGMMGGPRGNRNNNGRGPSFGPRNGPNQFGQPGPTPTPSGTQS